MSTLQKEANGEASFVFEHPAEREVLEALREATDLLKGHESQLTQIGLNIEGEFPDLATACDSLVNEQKPALARFEAALQKARAYQVLGEG